MIGRIIIASTMPAVNIVRPLVDAVPEKNGIKLRLSFAHGYTFFDSNGATTVIPQIPKTTLGIAASRSTTYPSVCASRRGA